MAHEAIGLELLHGRPGVREGNLVERHELVGRRGVVGAVREGHGPVDEVQVERVELKVAERLLQGGPDVLRSVCVVPELGGNPHIVAVGDARLERVGEGVPHLGLVLVNGRAVDMAIADLQGRFDGLVGLVRGRLPRAEAEHGHVVAVVEGNGLHQRLRS